MIVEGFGDGLNVIFSDDNAEKLVLRIRIQNRVMNDDEKMVSIFASLMHHYVLIVVVNCKINVIGRRLMGQSRHSSHVISYVLA